MDKTLFVTKEITEVSTTDLEGVGATRWVGEKCYRWVQNKHTAVTGIGSVVFHLYTNGADFLKKVYDGATAQLGALAGVAVSVIAVDGYGWIQVDGIAEAVSVYQSTGASAIVAGDKLVGVDAKLYGIQSVAMGIASTHERFVEALGTLASNSGTGTAVVTTTIRGFVRT